MRKSFNKEELETAFKRTGATLQKPITVYLLGGGAMCFRGQKAGTKDLDLIFTSMEDCTGFAFAIGKIGFSEAKQVETEYEDMMAAGIWKDKDDFRMDLFVNTVCRALSLSEKMAKRAVLLDTYGNLAVKLVSNEDVILFKGITERLGDIDDIAAIIQRATIDWHIVLEECVSQSKAYAWYGLLYNKLADIEEMFSMTIPITNEILALDRAALLKNAYNARIKSGMGKKKALADLARKGFSKKELEEL